MPSYRHVPWSQRLGLSFDESDYWQVAMPAAECFMYFVANLNRLFDDSFTLYVEGRELDPEVIALYQKCAAPHPEKVSPLDRHSGTLRFHVTMGLKLSIRMNTLAACKTYAQIAETLLIYKKGKVWMDGQSLGERLVKLSGELPGVEVRTFASGLLRGEVSRVVD